ncbi:EXD1 protein, partial [Amia calva]|nr:EXD1 protein [Amia calva]
IMHIQTQKVIGLGADGVGISQHERLCWLQIATKNKVYLFDILLLGARAFKNGLSMIMENNRILKVVHDCRGISGTLHHQFGVNLANVFDTQVADVLFFYTEMGGMLPDQVSTLQESIALHLQIPPSRLASLKIKMDLTKEESEVWYVRPCPVSFLKVMALSVIHLQPLRLVLLDALMSDYVTLVNSYLALWREEPVDLQIGCENTGTELPKELRELVNMQHERQERALEKYNVNEEGLLLRSSPKSTVNPSGCSAQPPRESKPKDLKTDWETSANNRQNRDGRDSCREESKSTRVGEGCFISKAAEQTDAKTVGAQAARDSGPAAASTRDNADPMKRISPSAKPDLPGGNPETKTCGDRGKKDTEEGLGSRSEASRAIEIAVDRPVEIGKASTLERDKLPLTYFTIGRGLSLQKSTGVSTEFPAVGKPQSVGGAAEAGAPGSLREERGKGVDNQHAGGGKPRGAERGTLSPNILSFGRGFFFQKP